MVFTHSIFAELGLYQAVQRTAEFSGRQTSVFAARLCRDATYAGVK
jgi:hypothetical protein